MVDYIAVQKNMADNDHLIQELRQRINKVSPLQDEPGFSTSDDTLRRFLKAREWKLEEAERLLTDSIEYRRRTRPLTVDCAWCHNRPGYHSMRQVGHDRTGRPVIYSNFAQATTHKNTAEDSVTHVTYLIENAKRTMASGVSTWVFVIDFTGMTLSSCNPKLGYGVANVLSNHYPERLGLAICVNHSTVFHGVWKAIKQFVHPHTAAKVRMARSKVKIAEVFSQVFSEELSEWLQDEITLNKQKPLSKQQVEFWNPPATDSDSHDPRGCLSYVRQYLDSYKESRCHSAPSDGASGQSQDATPSNSMAIHKPHPNIVDELNGREVAAIALSQEEAEDRQKEQSKVELQAESEEAERNRDGEEELTSRSDDSGDSEITASEQS